MRRYDTEPDGGPLTAPMARMAAFSRGIVRAATASTKSAFVSGLPCRRRPGRRPCSGSIAVQKTDVPERFIFWECSACGDNGRIAGFEGTTDDFSGGVPRTASRGPQRWVNLPPEAYRAWIAGDTAEYDIEALRAIYSAESSPEGITVGCTAGDAGDLLDSLAAEINHEPNRKRRGILESIYDRLSNCEESVRDASSAYAHGFFSAIAAGPPIMPTVWLQRFLQPGASMEALNADLARLMERYNGVVETLSSRREHFADATVQIARQNDGGAGLVEWQRGFFDAMELGGDLWTAFLKSRDGKGLLAPLAMIAQLEQDPAQRSWLADPGLRDGLGSSLGVMVARVWEAFRDEPPVRLEF